MNKNKKKSLLIFVACTFVAQSLMSMEDASLDSRFNRKLKIATHAEENANILLRYITEHARLTEHKGNLSGKDASEAVTLVVDQSARSQSVALWHEEFDQKTKNLNLGMQELQQEMRDYIFNRYVHIWLPTVTQGAIGFVANIASENSLYGKLVSNGIGYSLAKIFKIMRHYYPLKAILHYCAQKKLDYTINNNQGEIDTQKLVNTYLKLTSIGYIGFCKPMRAGGFYALGACMGTASRFTLDQILTFGCFIAKLYQNQFTTPEELFYLN